VFASAGQDDVISELPSVSPDPSHISKPLDNIYAVSPQGFVETANHSDVAGTWPRYIVTPRPKPLRPDLGPWTVVRFVRDWGNKISVILLTYGRADTRYAPQRVALTGLAASMLYVYAKTRGYNREDSRTAMRRYARMVNPEWQGPRAGEADIDDGPVWGPARDQLIEAGLVKVLSNGQLRVTPKGKEVAAKIPYSYNPVYWVTMGSQPILPASLDSP
jgi:hypothetical protein